MSTEYWCMTCKQKTKFPQKTQRYELVDHFFIEETNPLDVQPRLTELVLILLDKKPAIASSPTTFEQRISLPE